MPSLTSFDGTSGSVINKREGGEAGDAATASSTTRKPNPLKEASFLSKMFFSWPYPLLKLGMQRPLEENDLPDIPLSDTSAYNLQVMTDMWNREMERAKQRAAKRKGTATGGTTVAPSLHRAFVIDFLRTVWYVQPLMFCSSTAKLMQAVALGLLLETFEATEPTNQGYIWAAVLVVCGAVILFEHHHVFFITWRKGMQYRIACIAAIYAKALRLKSTAGVQSASTGKVLNIASNDVERFLLATLFISYGFWAPVQSLAILGLGVKLIGTSFAAGYGLLVCGFVPLQFYLSQRFATLRSRVASITDRRVTLVSQAVAGVRVMKMNGWERQFETRIADVRLKEITEIQRANRLKALNEAVFFSANVVVSIVIFLVHIAMGGQLTPRNVYTTMVLINVLQIELTKHLSLAVMGVSECWVSIGRIRKYLAYPELDCSHTGMCSEEGGEDGGATEAKDDETDSSAKETGPVVRISISNATCYWNGNGNRRKRLSKSDDATEEERESASDPFAIVALDKVSLKIHKGELTCIIGRVGCGKSALLQMLAGELEIQSGNIDRIYQSLAYAAQDPWVMDGTVKENILMGENFEEEWYGKVVAACSLLTDFDQLRDGDLTIVGDRGVQLSGGQRARIGLARALYRDADVLLLDDPLSAVDSRVGRVIFYDAIQNLAVSRNKCVVLATHQHQFIHDQRCVLMASGRIDCVGSYDECVAASMGKLSKSLYNAEDSTVSDAANLGDAVERDDVKQGKGTVSVDASTKTGSDDETGETKMQGVVKFTTYKKYSEAMGGIAVGIFLIVLFSITQASVAGTIAALGLWSEKPANEQTSRQILGIVIGLGLCVVTLAIVRAFSSFSLLIKASRKLHDTMTVAVLRARIEFFDTQPLGRILNRFSADVGSNDDMLPTTSFDFAMCFFLCLGAMITTLITLPYTFLAVPPLLWYFIWVRRIYVTTTRELKRLEGLARSPMFAMLGEALGGVATMRANGATDYFRTKFENAHNAHTRAFFSFIASSRWVGFRMDAIMTLFISCATFLAVIFNTQGLLSVDPAILGLALTMLLQLSGLFQWAVRQSAEVVNLMVSVERVSEYGDLPPEAALTCPEDDPGWPRQGSIEVKDLSVRYRSKLPLSLKNVSFKIESGQRIGVVGRTGSGKSTLIQALFRLLEAEEGKIVIDGVDIAGLGLHKLRTSMSVIPQTPTLFSGCTIRENLDPFDQYGDRDIRSALLDASMVDAIEEQAEGLDSIVAEGGSNFSCGQRQLLCLARAILRKSPILVLDEATANVDSRTDALLQEAVKKSFDGATILSVAHRLDTVIEYDKILVLGAGQVVAFDSPHRLSLEENGVFASMIDDTGKGMANNLRRRASRASLVGLVDAVGKMGAS
mmetsp:Transcript_3038/g.8791  ORF Transcript_3038/g.8791 Transcript_3038/m.8791 type:complete len:1373 (-) Transcript_3038:1207-5325(-)|eukprot:CAMPEP_0181031388 /NCGR_PEP_ID=MMETSP1070-20121207/6207_1 /TAXON_ID=265543 /ORGANISM="Minutocellus polymorphus, Strain NH13" /LENGTH=1372 /DNA_ID=CAMNT_0023108765 /DNA_START=241 /DNA_END=4359 /DNA_ORIENTATION=+